MAKVFSSIGAQPSLGSMALGVPFPWRIDLSDLDLELARAFDAIRECARIAWWDGSAIGLQLNGLLGLFETFDADVDADEGDAR